MPRPTRARLALLAPLALALTLACAGCGAPIASDAVKVPSKARVGRRMNDGWKVVVIVMVSLSPCRRPASQ